jgi:hypothetical protein
MTGTLLGLAEEVAVELGDGWSPAAGACPRGTIAYVRHRDGRAVYLGTAVGLVPSGRVLIHGEYPGRWYSDESNRCRITVSAGRTAAAIAADIRRRLLPGYEPLLARARASVAQQQEDLEDRERVAAEILAAVPGAERSGVQAREHGVALRLPGPGYRYNVDIYSGAGGTNVNLDLRGVPAEDAVRMLAALGADEAGDAIGAAPRPAVTARLRLLPWRRPRAAAA